MTTTLFLLFVEVFVCAGSLCGLFAMADTMQLPTAQNACLLARESEIGSSGLKPERGRKTP